MKGGTERTWQSRPNAPERRALPIRAAQRRRPVLLPPARVGRQVLLTLPHKMGLHGSPFRLIESLLRSKTRIFPKMRAGRRA